MPDDPNQTIYLDNNATTRVAPEVFEAMVPFLTDLYGNPSSAHALGRRAAPALAKARESLAALLGCEPAEIVFTSCGTESDNAALASALRTTGKRHIVTSQTEHSAILNQAEALEAAGFAATYLPPGPDGIIDPLRVEKAIRSDTALVSIIWANNETGVLAPLAEIGARCRARNVLFHTDAVQVPGKLPIRLHELPVDFLSLSGHKLHAPKGVGALFVRKGLAFAPHVIGGGQENHRRGGTENIASIAGLGRAAELALEHLDDEQSRVRALRNHLERGILESVPGSALNGHPEHRLPNTANISFPDLEGEAILLALDRHGLCVSTGSACTTGSLEPSHVLSAMGVPWNLARGAVRFSLSRYNSQAEIDRALAIIPEIIKSLRLALPSR